MYTLIAEISEEDLPAIQKAHECIVLVKNVGIGAPVAWIAQLPGTTTTAFQWGSDYSLFATTVGDQVGTQVTMVTCISAQPQCKYPFVMPQGFGPASTDSSLPPDEFRIDNYTPPSVSDSLSFGLAQAINGSDAQPLNVQFLPPMQSLAQRATDSLRIWLQSDVQAGQIVEIPPSGPQLRGSSTIRSYSTVVRFSGNAPTQTVRYVSKLGAFVAVQA